jgi:ribosomal protein S18 acetylase RimI-like enzyme
MSIRLLNPADAASYVTIRLKSLKEHPEAFLSSYEAEKDMPLETTETRLQVSVERFTLGAFSGNGELVGVATFIQESREKIRHKGNVVAVYVNPEARRQRLGHQLMTELIARAAQLEGLEILNLTVTGGNRPAKRLYESLGFTCYGKELNAMKVNGSYFDEELMSLRL